MERRRFLQVMGGGAASAAALPLLAACGGSGGTSTASGSGGDVGGKGIPASDKFGTVDITALKKLMGFDKLDAKTLGTGKTVDITCQLALTGSASFYGNVMSKGLKLAGQHIKAMGGPTINLTLQDNKGGDAQASISGVRELLSKNTEFMMSSIGASLGSILPGVAAGNVVCLNTGTGYSLPPYKGAAHYWETDGDANLIFDFLGSYLADQYPGKKKIALVTADAGAAQNTSGLAALNAGLKDGAKVSNPQYVPFGTTNSFAGTVARIASQNPDIVLAPLAPSLGLFMIAYKQAGLTAPVIQYGYPITNTDITAAPTQLIGAQFVSQFFDPQNPDNPWGQFFAQEYDKAYGTAPLYPDLYATNYYISQFTFWQLFMKAWAEGKEPTAELVNGYLEASPTLLTMYGGDKSAVGKTTIDGSTHFANMLMGVYEIEKGPSFKHVATSNPDGTGYSKL
jgi:ABC-type branched-subunit amino acid transport system substrate-binding protein